MTEIGQAVLSLPDADRATVLDWLSQARVDDAESANLLSAWKNELAQFVETDETFTVRESKIADAHARHSELCAERNRAVRPFKNFIDSIGSKLKAWLREQERLVAAEKARIESENRKREEARRDAEAQAAIDQGATEAEVDAIVEQPMVVAAAPLPKPKIEGFRTPPKRFKAEVIPVTGKMKLIKAVACVCGKCKCQGNPALLGLLEPNIPSLNQMANAQKEHLNLPGVKAVPA